MNNNEVTYDDLLLIDELVKLSNSILNIYQKLYQFEINDQKGSIEYQKYLDYLKIAVSSEDELYDNKKFDYECCSRIMYFITSTKFSRKTVSDLDAIALLNISNISYRRIVNKLNQKILLYSGNISVDDRLHPELKELVYQNGFIRELLTQDLFNSIIYFSECEENKDLKKVKFYLSFINKGVEATLIENDFCLDELLTNTNFFAFLSGIDEEMIDNVKRSLLVKLAIKQMYKLLSARKNNNSLLIRKLILRAVFVLVDDDILFDIKSFYDELDNKNIFGKQIIDSCFVETYNDRMKKISLKFN